MMRKISPIDWTALVLVFVGAVNWGLVGIGNLLDANWNLVNLVAGSIPELEAVIYLLVGVAGLYLAYFAVRLNGSFAESAAGESGAEMPGATPRAKK